MTGLPYVRLGRYDLHSDEWYAARAGRLGGSEIAAVMGLSPYESRFSLWHRKRGMVGPQEVNAEMSWGTRLEPVILARYIEAHDWLDPYDNIAATYVSVDRPWQVANPDGLWLGVSISDKAPSLDLVEVKFSPFGDGWGKPGTDEIPVYYRCQVMHYMDVFGCDTADVAVLISGCDYREYTVRYDEADAKLMRDAAVEFLESVKSGDRPAIDSSDETYRVIRQLHPDIDGTKVDVDPSVAADYVDSRVVLQAAAARESTAKSVLADAMGNAHTAWCNGYKIADRRARGDGTPYLQAARKLPAAHELRETA